MARWNAELFARLVAEKYGSVNKFARAIDTSPQGVRAWMPANGPAGDRQQVVADALGTTVDALHSLEPTAARADSPVQADRIEAKLDEVLDELRRISADGAVEGEADDGAVDDRPKGGAELAWKAIEETARVPKPQPARTAQAGRGSRGS